MTAAVWLLLFSCRGALAQAPVPPPSQRHDATVQHAFDDLEHWKSVFDDPSRDQWQKPGEVVKALDLRPGMCVADLGAGTGYFSRHLSAAVGDGGCVLTVDIEPALVVYLRDRADKEATVNVVPILASPGNPRLPPARVDVVLIVDTLHHINDRLEYLRRLKRSLTPDGRVVVIDFKKEELPVGPPPEHKLMRAQIVGDFQQAGYHLVGEPPVLPYQYFLIFRPN